MEKVVRVSIAGIAFVFEEDAYRVMREYIDRLERGYADNPDGAEIVADIEARIAELILSEQPAGQAVGLSLAERIVARMGTPDEEAAEEEKESTPTGERFPRRLYRNSEGARLGGVCSGLGTYFGVDPVWVRLGFFAPLLLSVLSAPFVPLAGFFGTLFGVFFLLYFLLWVAIPQARTPRQRLEMQGEKITARTIERRMSADKEQAAAPARRRRFEGVLAELVYVSGRVALFFVKVLAVLVALAFGVVGIGLLVAMFGVATGTAWTGFPSFLPGMGFSSVFSCVVLLLLFFIPVMLVVWWLLRLIFGWQGNRTFVSVAGGIWLIALVYLIVMFFRSADRIREFSPAFDVWRGKTWNEVSEVRRTLDAAGIDPDGVRFESVHWAGDSVVLKLRGDERTPRSFRIVHDLRGGGTTVSGLDRSESDEVGQPGPDDRGDTVILRTVSTH